MATLMCPRTKPQMATVRPGVMKRIDKDETRKGELIKFDVDFTEADMNVEMLEVVKSDKKSFDLTEAKLIVSGARGIGSPQGFDMIRDVADALGAEVGSSRACVDVYKRQIPAPIRGIETREIRHKNVCEKDGIADFVKGWLL